MNCSKCSGFSIFETTYQYQGWRCFNCGKRVFYEPYIIPHPSIEFFLRHNPKDLYKQVPQEFLDCIICKTRVKRKTLYQKYCSAECRYDARYPNKIQMEKICTICEEPFMATYKNRMYCAPKCLNMSNNRRKAMIRNRKKQKNE